MQPADVRIASVAYERCGCRRAAGNTQQSPLWKFADARHSQFALRISGTHNGLISAVEHCVRCSCGLNMDASACPRLLDPPDRTSRSTCSWPQHNTNIRVVALEAHGVDGPRR